MKTSVSIVAGGATLLAYFAWTCVASWLRLRHIPGPAGPGWSKLWLIRRQATGKFVLDLEQVCKQYGPLVRIGPDWVVTNDSAEIRRIWNVRSGYYRSPWYRGFRFDPSKDSLLTMTDNKEHDRIRGHVLPGYNGRGLGDQEQIIDEQMIKFIKLIEDKYLSRRGKLRPLDMSKTMHFLTQDIISSIEFGKPFGYLDADDDIWGVVGIFEALLGTSMVVALFPFFVKLLKTPLMKPLLPKATDTHGPGRLLGVITSQLDTRYGSNKKRGNDVLQTFVDSGLTRSEVEAEALLHMVGGTDTSALALRNIIFFVSSNSVAYRKLQTEIDEAAKTVSSEIVPDKLTKTLPYLQAVIKEGLRMWPPVMGLMARMSDKDDVICGFKVPANTHVAWAGWALMKDKSVFGDDAEVFDPARWLDADPTQLKNMEAVQGLVFASGSRWECLGKRLAYIELGKGVFELFRRFDFSMLDPVQPFTWVSFGSTIHDGMKVKVTARQ